MAHEHVQPASLHLARVRLARRPDGTGSGPKSKCIDCAGSGWISYHEYRQAIVEAVKSSLSQYAWFHGVCVDSVSDSYDLGLSLEHAIQEAENDTIFHDGLQDFLELAERENSVQEHQQVGTTNSHPASSMQNVTLPSLETVTIHQVDGQEINDLIQALAGHEVDPVSNGEVMGDDSSGVLIIRVDDLGDANDYIRNAYSDFKKTGEGLASWVIEGFLIELAEANKIPYGTYHLEYSWG